MDVQPLTLTGRIIRLEPLSTDHVDDLVIAGCDEGIWRYMRYGSLGTTTKMRAWVQEMLALQERQTDLPFAVIFLESEQAVGVTRYLNISIDNRAVEIGGTWYSPQYQRTGVNTEAKYMLLRHAFEVLGCVRVQFKTDSRNQRSQRAIERLGAVNEGLLRNHMILPDGYVRDSVFYSVIDSEWPRVKVHLEKLMAKVYPVSKA